MSQIIKTNEFRSKVENKAGIVIVDFFATWCAPCKMLAPVFSALGEEVKDRAEFLKVDIDKSMELAQKFQVSTVPTVIIFKDGKEMDRLVGFIPKVNLKNKVESYL
ncbi:MAG: thioredoxin [Terrisporobacter sp.]|uniref:thioredoxin n=1 Tax=Terrisporobacter sp. TaxID=1965305 RepID=UPI002FC94CCC